MFLGNYNSSSIGDSRIQSSDLLASFASSKSNREKLQKSASAGQFARFLHRNAQHIADFIPHNKRKHYHKSQPLTIDGFVALLLPRSLNAGNRIVCPTPEAVILRLALTTTLSRDLYTYIVAHKT